MNIPFIILTLIIISIYLYWSFLNNKINHQLLKKVYNRKEINLIHWHTKFMVDKICPRCTVCHTFKTDKIKINIAKGDDILRQIDTFEQWNTAIYNRWTHQHTVKTGVGSIQALKAGNQLSNGKFTCSRVVVCWTFEEKSSKLHDNG